MILLPSELGIEARPLPGALPAWHAAVAPEALCAVVEKARAHKGRLVALWGSDETPRGAGYAVHVALGFPQGLAWLTAALERDRPRYPSIAEIYPAAMRMQ